MQKNNMKSRMRDVYLNKSSSEIAIGVYNRFLPRGSFGREGRNNGLGIIDYFPPVSLLAPPWHILPGFLSEVGNTEFRIANKWQSGRQLQNRIFETPVGTLNQIIESDNGGIGSEHILKHYITTKDDYGIMQYIVENTVFRENYETFVSRERYLGDDGVVLARLDRCGYQKLLIELVGPEKFHMDMFDFPGIVEELIHAIDLRCDEQFETVLNLGPDLLWQPDNVTSDMTPPDYFKKYIQPVYIKRKRKLGDEKAYVVHMDGRLSALAESLRQIEGFIIESFSFPEIGGDLEPSEAGKMLAPHRVFPNFPSNWSMLSSEEIEEKCRSVKTELTDLGYPLLFQISEDLPRFAYERVLPVLTGVFNS